jgi:5-methylcytosine-specific restriction protein A
MTTHQRGYGWDWQRLRLQILARDTYLCRCDECKGGELRLRVAHEVDHIVPKAHGGSDNPSNLRAVNRYCHRRITLEQQGKRPKQ